MTGQDLAEELGAMYEGAAKGESDGDILLFEVPPGTAHAEYTVQGQRGSRVGTVSEIYVMHIGALGPRLADMSAA